jgi:hypothetical protein
MAVMRQLLVVLAATLVACSLSVQGDPVLHKLKNGDSMPLLARPLVTTKVSFSSLSLFLFIYLFIVKSIAKGHLINAWEVWR